MSASAPITQDVMTIPRKTPEGGKINLVGLTRDQLRAVLIEHGTKEKQAKMRVGQIWQWIYQWGVRDFHEMTNLAKAYRAELDAKFVIEIPEVVSKQVSTDGTRKYLVRIAGGHEVEVVYIPEDDRGTLCISSQVGCTLTCSFCHTGTQKLVRNLTPGEIIGQVMVARDDLEGGPRGVLHQVGQTSHGAGVVHDLADHARGRQACQSGQVHGALGLAGAHQRATVAGPQRKDVTWHDQV